MLSLAASPPALHAKGYTDVAMLGTPTHDTRYTTDRVVYVEGLVDGRWVGRYWSAGGRINVPYELLADDAFQLQIEGQWLSSGWRWVGAHEEPRTEPGGRADLDSQRVPLDLNALIPIPRRIPRKGFVEAGQEWMWANWGVRWPIRRVTFAIERKRRGTSGVEPVAGPD